MCVVCGWVHACSEVVDVVCVVRTEHVCGLNIVWCGMCVWGVCELNSVGCVD